MKLSDDEMEIINKAEEITGYELSITDETYYLNEEEAMLLIRYLVEACEEQKNDRELSRNN